jgi:hypothetical protein
MICCCRVRPSRLLLLSLVLCAAGCGQADPSLKPVYPVQGSLFVKGKPAKGAAVMFHPLPLEAGRPTALTSRGTVSDDGAFRLTTYNTDDGAPEGEYAVTVYWPGKRSRGASEDADALDLPPDQLGLRYVDPSASAIKIQIKAPETRLEPFQLR